MQISSFLASFSLFLSVLLQFSWWPLQNWHWTFQKKLDYFLDFLEPVRWWWDHVGLSWWFMTTQTFLKIFVPFRCFFFFFRFFCQNSFYKTSISEQVLKVHFDNDVPSNHVALLPYDWLRENCYCDVCLKKKLSDRDVITRNSQTPKKMPVVDYDEIKDNPGQFLFECASTDVVITSNVLYFEIRC